MSLNIPFNKPSCIGNELNNISKSVENCKISGDGSYTKLCNQWFYDKLHRDVLLTHSCTSALEMMALLLDIKSGDEIIMPSYTFVSTANAFVLRGATPVFVDIRPDTLNIDENLVEKAITTKTKAIVAVHYAGVSCEMDKLQEIAKKHGLFLLEDAAQGFGSSYKGKSLGTIGDLGTYSFHETKNIISGEGGCLIINNKNLKERAEIIREKGTNRSQFYRGQIDKYTWVDIGSSYLPSDMIAAFLYGQLEVFDKIQAKRMQLWVAYNKFFEKYEEKGFIRRPIIPAECIHNAHMYYVLFNNLEQRSRFIEYLKNIGINCVFHYIIFHLSPFVKKFERYLVNMNITNRIYDTLVRLPLYYDLDANTQAKIFDTIASFFEDFINE